MPATIHTIREDLVGLPAVAERLGVHRATVNDMVRSKRLPARRRGAHWFVKSSDLEEFAREYVRPSNAPDRRQRGVPSSAPKIVELLNEVGAANALEISRLIGLHEGNARKHLRLMEMEGLVRRRRDGQWECAPSVRATEPLDTAARTA